MTTVSNAKQRATLSTTKEMTTVGDAEQRATCELRKIDDNSE
jgi:hypothetical protein